MRTLSLSTAVLLGLSLSLGACDDETTSPTDEKEPLLEPPAEGAGIQVGMVTTLEPGTEVEHCRFVRAPAEGLNINRDEVKYSGGSHHVLLYMTQYEDIPTVDLQGDEVDTSGVFDCSEGVNFRWAIKSILAGSQNATGESVVKFPEDVAIRVPPNAVMLLNAHYINASQDVVEPEVAVNLHTIPDEAVKHEGGMLFWYNPFIKVDAKGTGLATMSCPLPEDIHLENGQSHMHKRGVNYAATLISPEGDREVIYENTAWEGVPVATWDDKVIEKGSRIEFFCEYQNSEDRTIWQGPKTTDEMCMWIGSYWPASDQVSLCSSNAEDAVNGQSMAAEWVGQGEGTCGEALGCLQAIDQESTFDEFIQSLTECINATSESESPYVSRGVTCLLTHDDPVNDCMAEIQECLNHE